jgi:tubulin monoglycylase TTLL3/8
MSTLFDYDDENDGGGHLSDGSYSSDYDDDEEMVEQEVLPSYNGADRFSTVELAKSIFTADDPIDVISIMKEYKAVYEAIENSPIHKSKNLTETLLNDNFIDTNIDVKNDDNPWNKGIVNNENQMMMSKKIELLKLKNKKKQQGKHITYEEDISGNNNGYAAVVESVINEVNTNEVENNDRILKMKPLTDVEERHRNWLQSITNKRKEEEEQILKLALKAEKRRKKFKEALLAKALKARAVSQEQEEIEAINKKNSLKSKGNMTEDEKQRLEDEKKEEISAIRKKFKEQHKKLIESLENRHKEEQDKTEYNKILDEKKKAKYRRKIDNMVRSKKDRLDGSDDEEVNDISDVEAEDELRVQSAGADIAVGSGLSAIRKKSIRLPNNSEPQTSPSADDSTPIDNEEEEKLKMLKKLQLKLQQEKVSSMLAAIAEQKKKEDNEKKQKEERKKRRMLILQERVLLEAGERKLMMLEDKPRYRTGEKSNSSNITISKPASKVTAEMADALINRLKVKSHRSSDGTEIAIAAPVRDYADWKRKNSVPQDGLVFVMTGWYPCVKQALLDRGWFFNNDPTSPHCDLKWTLRSIDISQETLLPWQLTNHFLKNVAITTKVGLLKSLKSCVWLADVNVNDIIPRGYDLSNPQEAQAFIDDFRFQKAESILKMIYAKATSLPVPEDGDFQEGSDFQADTWTVVATPRPLGTINLDKFLINEAVFKACCDVLEKSLKPLEEDFIDEQGDDNDEAENVAVESLEWEIISLDIFNNERFLPPTPPEPVDDFLRDKDEDSKSRQQTLAQKENMRRKQKIEQQNRESANEMLKKLIPLGTNGLRRVHNILSRLKIADRSQAGLNGKGETAKNMWIVKPAAKSRGRGITTFNDLPKLLKYVDAGSHVTNQWIVQKYMENSLTIAQRKFDLRQWVLVTDWNPLTIYFYDECYARLSVEEYSISDQDMDDAYVHLVNNSIGKNSEHFNKLIYAENGDKIEGYMIQQENFKNLIIHKTGGKDYMTEKIHPRMKDIAKWSLMCASEMIEHRKNSWELYGFDFMVDDEYNAWLIEINSSPACDYSTKVTERYVQKALVELLAVVLDTRTWESQPKKTRGEKPDTGGWECIYKGPLLEMPVASFGTDLSLNGIPMKTPKRYVPAPVPTFTINSNAVNTASNKDNQLRKSGTLNISSSKNTGNNTVVTSTNEIATAVYKQPITNPRPPPAYFPRQQSIKRSTSNKDSKLNTSLDTSMTDSVDDVDMQQTLLFNDSDDDLSIEKVMNRTIIEKNIQSATIIPTPPIVEKDVVVKPVVNNSSNNSTNVTSNSNKTANSVKKAVPLKVFDPFA